jgi:hypothetical protein
MPASSRAFGAARVADIVQKVALFFHVAKFVLAVTDQVHVALKGNLRRKY